VDPTDNIYKFIGRSRFEGFEFSATGELTPNLSLYLTGLALNPRQIASATASLVGKLIENTPRRTGSAFAEYRFGDSGFAIKGGAYYTGKRAINASNSAFIPGYTLIDLGASYATTLGGKELTFRVNADNVTGKRYWAATGSSLLGEGLPSVVKFSIDVAF
jgi:iron complex outermembrane receptor protein